MILKNVIVSFFMQKYDNWTINICSTVKLDWTLKADKSARCRNWQKGYIKIKLTGKKEHNQENDLGQSDKFLNAESSKKNSLQKSWITCDGWQCAELS